MTAPRAATAAANQPDPNSSTGCYLTSFAYRFDRRFRLDSIVERLAWAAVRTAPHPYRVVIADA